MYEMWTIASDDAVEWGVCQSAKTAERIEIQFGVDTRGYKECCVRCGSRFPPPPQSEGKEAWENVSHWTVCYTQISIQETQKTKCL